MSLLEVMPRLAARVPRSSLHLIRLLVVLHPNDVGFAAGSSMARPRTYTAPCWSGARVRLPQACCPRRDQALIEISADLAPAPKIGKARLVVLFMKLSFKAFVILLAVPLALIAGAATIYKWVDESGVTHYSTSAPPEVGAREIRVPDSPIPASAAAGRPPQKTLQEVLDDYRTSRAEREEAQRKLDAAAAERRAEILARKQRCIVARQNAYTLQQRTPVFQLNAKGDRVYLDDKSRASELERLAREIQTYCDP